MATVNTFVGYCCSLVSRTGETEIAGTLVDLAELQLPISDKEQLHEQLPGLTLRVDNVTTTYVLITSHSVLPGSGKWKTRKAGTGTGTEIRKRSSDAHMYIPP